jgi:hypothetical protein
MLRGSVVVFTGIASFLFLGRKLKRHHYFGMVRDMALRTPAVPALPDHTALECT